MNSTLVSRALVAACLLAPLGARAQNTVLDAGFGDDGLVRIDSVAGSDHDDQGVGICPGPGTTQVVVGTRMASGMLMLVRLLEDGSPDPTYGENGHVEYAIETPAALARTLCLGNGRIDIAYTNLLARIELLRVQGNGMPDPAFGADGRLTIDPSTLPGAGAASFTLHGMDRGANGEILLGGEIGGSGIGNGQPTLVRVNANGTVHDSRVFAYEGDYQDGGYIAAAAYAPNGDLWLGGVVRRNADGGSPWFRQTLNGIDLSGAAPVVGPADSRYAISGGRAVRPGVLALSAQVKGNSVGSVWEPRLLVLREDGENEVALPLAPGLPELEPGGGLGLVTLTGGQRIMYGATIGHVASYFARIDIGENAAGDALDTSFGSGGVAAIRVPGPTPDCEPRQGYARLSLWGEAPVFVGSAAEGCEPPLSRDVVVGRFGTGDRIFGNGFD